MNIPEMGKTSVSPEKVRPVEPGLLGGWRRGAARSGSQLGAGILSVWDAGRGLHVVTLGICQRCVTPVYQ